MRRRRCRRKMTRAITIGVALLLSAGAALCDQKGPAPPRAQPAPPKAASGGVPRPNGGVPKGGAKLANPGNVMERLAGMTPEQRERVLEKLPPARQSELRQRLADFDSRPPAQKERLLALYARFSSLPPETQAMLRQRLQMFNNIPLPRRQVLRMEIQRLHNLPEDQRSAVFGREPFRARHTPEEIELLRFLSDNYPFPDK
jgi:Protein of unknown function (DUF3106)